MSEETLNEVLAATEQSKPVPSKMNDSTRDLANRAYSMRSEGLTVKEIATFFGKPESTIYRWLRDVVKEHREFLQQQTASEVIADALLFFDQLEQMYLSEINLLDVSDARVVDPVTGEVTIRQIDPRIIQTRLQCLKNAMDARKGKLDLLTNVGLVPKSPDRIYKDWKGREEKDESQVEEVKEKRAPEEIRENIVRLLQNCQPVS